GPESILQQLLHLLDPFATDSTDGHGADLAKFCLKAAQIRSGVRQVHLVGSDGKPPRRQPWVIQFQFSSQRSEVVKRVAAFAAGHIEHEKQELTARDMPQELMPKSLVFVCSFNQAGNIRDRRSSIAIQLN